MVTLYIERVHVFMSVLKCHINEIQATKLDVILAISVFTSVYLGYARGSHK